MQRVAVVMNWVMLAILGIASILTVIRNPGGGGAGVLFGLAPYATALLVFNSTPHRGLIAVSMFFNAVFIIFGLLVLILPSFGLASGQYSAILLCLLFVAPSVVNSKELIRLWGQARAATKDR